MCMWYVFMSMVCGGEVGIWLESVRFWVVKIEVPLRAGERLA